MRKLYFLVVCFLIVSNLMAQIGINTEQPRGLLEVNSGTSKNQGIVLAIVTKYEDVINSHNASDPVATGTVVFDESRQTICYKTDTKWICPSGNGDVDPIQPELQEYIKASNTKSGAFFGSSVALSSDGNTLAVGSNQESSNAAGIYDTDFEASGAVYVFTRSGVTWEQKAYIKASNTKSGAEFGDVLSLSSDGNTLAVGSKGEAFNAGAVYVFTRSGVTWDQQAYIKASNTKSRTYFGSSVALSSDGNTLAVGSYLENSNATGINGDQTNNSAEASGAVYVFTRSGVTWDQQAYIKASNTKTIASFGLSVALSSDGNTLAVGSSKENSNAAGIYDRDFEASGAVYVFTRSGVTWEQKAYIKASNPKKIAHFGTSVALSSDGNTLAVGSYLENSNATGINGDQTNIDASQAGAVYVFTRSGITWDQQAYIKASNTMIGGYFGTSVALSSNGNTLAVGSFLEKSNAAGIYDTNLNGAGAVYVFTRSGVTWEQKAYIKALYPKDNAHFGFSVALSSDGNTLAVGSQGEASNATGINGDQTNIDASQAGAVFIYKL